MLADFLSRMETLDDDAALLVLSWVTVPSQWQPVYTNADAALDPGIIRVHRRPHHQACASASCYHPRPDLTLVCRRFLSVLRSTAGEQLWEPPLARLHRLFRCDSLCAHATTETWLDPRHDLALWRTRSPCARFAALDWHATRVHEHLTQGCREAAPSARGVLANKVEAQEAQGELEWEHGDDVEAVLRPALIAAAFVDALFALFQCTGTAADDVACVLEGGEGAWAGGMCARLPQGVWTHLMASLGYRYTLCRDNSTRRRCYRWLREDVGEAAAGSALTSTR